LRQDRAFGGFLQDLVPPCGVQTNCGYYVSECDPILTNHDGLHRHTLHSVIDDVVQVGQ